jgi:hypothetical protein
MKRGNTMIFFSYEHWFEGEQKGVAKQGTCSPFLSLLQQRFFIISESVIKGTVPQLLG